MKSTRRSFTIAGSMAVSFGGSLQALANAPVAKPNILFIFTDQQHAGMMGCTGNPFLKTPEMDSLAATGTRFDLAYCANPVCSPSRFSMMTGVLPSRINMESNSKAGVAKPSAEVLSRSLGQVFRSAGYETVYGGKVHLPMTLESIGFTNITNDAGPKLADTCAQFLRQKRDKPFLMVASFINPHDICFMAIQDEKSPGSKVARPKPLVDALELPTGMSKKEFFDTVCPPLPANHEIPAGEPENVLAGDTRGFRTHTRKNWTEEQWRMHRWAYARLTEKVDAEIGVVLSALRETGLDQNTVVVFSSDHGDMDAAHRLEHKSLFYEEAARVPLIVSWKGVTTPGQVDKSHLVSTGLDLIPTLCDFAGIPPPPALKGKSIRALAEGRAPASWRNSLVSENGNSRMVRTERYKYIVYGSGARREQLIDVIADPGEMQNLALDPAAAPVLVEHRRLLKEWYQQHGETLDRKYTVANA